MDALFELPAQAETEVGLRRACQVALLRDRLRAAGAPEGASHLLDPLQALTLDDLARHATPFFWQNVLRCHAACSHPGPRLPTVLRHLLMTGFDAFFPVVPDGSAWLLPAADDPAIVLPWLGVRLEASAGPARLCRAGRNVLQVESDGRRATTVPLDEIPARARFPWLPVGREGTARLLPDSHPALFPGPDAADGSADPAGQAASITSALELIQEVDPRRGAQIAAGISWYVPLPCAGPEFRQSHTLRDLRGVMFLSCGQERRMLAETLVHEYYHNVLNAWMEWQPLLAGGDEPRFYSPWREDPRPLAGLLHALYVFAGVAEFLLRAETAPGLADQRGALHDRRRRIVAQLRLGHAQAREELFTPPGRKLVEGLAAIIDRHEVELGLPRDRLPDALAAHLRKWCAAHPRLAAAVRRPVGAGA